MDNKNENKPLLKKKEWLEYIDKLITRESIKHNRSGITVWVVIAALAFLLIKIIDFFYSNVIVDIKVILNLFCFYIVVLILFYIIITIFKTRSNTKKQYFSSSYIDERRNRFFYWFINLIFFVLINVSSKEYRGFYIIINALLPLYILTNISVFLDENNIYKWFDILLYKLHILCLRLKLFLYLILLVICTFLIINNINYLIIHPVQKEIPDVNHFVDNLLSYPF